jgi:hypothetical protein
MQVSRNEKMITRRSKMGTYATLGGLGVLVVGMVISFQVQYIWFSMLALLIGFVLSQYGNYNMRRWGRSPRPDQQLETLLKGFDDHYHLYAWTALPAPYVLLTPQGLYAFTMRDQTGKVNNQGRKWSSKWSAGKILMVFAQEGLGNPTIEAIDTTQRLAKWLNDKLPDVQANIQPAIVWMTERVELDVSEPEVPVVEGKSLKKWLRGTGKGDTLKASDYRAIEALFDEQVPA